MSKQKKEISNNKNLLKYIIIIACIVMAYALNSININDIQDNNKSNIIENKNSYNLENIPKYNGQKIITINDNIPFFNENEFTTEAFETYSKLDNLGRCGVAYANICKEIMPTEERGNISYKPTGWVQNKYTSIGGYLYNRCHLIAWQLASENNNKENLITGTIQLNRAMIDYENTVAKYIKSHENYHVLYRVTPIFDGNNLLASGVQIEAMSVEDKGAEICFNIYIYNVQDGIEIDYSTGENYEKLLLGE